MSKPRCIVGRIVTAWATVVVAVTGCGKDSSPKDEALCPVTEIALQNASEVEEVLGAPDEVLPITRNKSQMPGEFREYVLPNDIFVQVRFHKGLAVAFVITLKEGPRSPEAALRLVGLDAADLTVLSKTPSSMSWRGGALGLQFDKLEVSTPPDDVSRWNKVEVAIKR